MTKSNKITATQQVDRLECGCRFVISTEPGKPELNLNFCAKHQQDRAVQFCFTWISIMSQRNLMLRNNLQGIKAVLTDILADDEYSIPKDLADALRDLADQINPSRRD